MSLMKNVTDPRIGQSCARRPSILRRSSLSGLARWNINQSPGYRILRIFQKITAIIFILRFFPSFLSPYLFLFLSIICLSPFFFFLLSTYIFFLLSLLTFYSFPSSPPSACFFKHVVERAHIARDGIEHLAKNFSLYANDSVFY